MELRGSAEQTLRDLDAEAQGFVEALRAGVRPGEIAFALQQALLPHEDLRERAWLVRRVARRAKLQREQADQLFHGTEHAHWRLRRSIVRTWAEQLRGETSPEPELMRHLIDLACAAEPIKRDDRSQVFRLEHEGRQVMLKRFVRPASLRYRWRISPGRHSWLTAHCLRRCELSVPEPLGFAEVHAGAQLQSWFAAEWIDHAITVRAWLKPQAHQWSVGQRRTAADALFLHWVQLYAAGCYHADTKGGNMLVTDPGSAAPKLWWIDLDAIRLGHIPARREVLRNLAQFNGSIGRRISREDRAHFLRRFYPFFPWLQRADVLPRLEATTRRRLRREVERVCGP